VSQRDGIAKFENERIKTLQEERLYIQKKTFTKWMNSFLFKVRITMTKNFYLLFLGLLKSTKERMKNISADAWMMKITRIYSSYLIFFRSQAKMEVEDLFVDLADGVKLLKLLEIISGEKIGKPNGGKMRVHKIENVNKSLAFLHTKVSL
jgi:spectrin beta